MVPALPEKQIDHLKALIVARNIELHSDRSGFVDLDLTEILSSCFALSVQLLQSVERAPGDVFDADTAAQAQLVYDALKKDRRNRVSGLIKAHKERFFGLAEDEQKEHRKAGTLPYTSAVMKTGHHVKAVPCPACKCQSALVGVPVGKSSPKLIDGEIVQEVRVVVSSFSCKSCGLEIRGLDELIATGFSSRV